MMKTIVLLVITIMKPIIIDNHIDNKKRDSVGQREACLVDYDQVCPEASGGIFETHL